MENVNLNSKMSIHEVLEAMRNAKETGSKVEVTGLWYDWFCKESSLERKGKSLLAKLKSIVKACETNSDGNYNKKFSTLDTYVFFKNNCPCSGRLYDDFRICDRKTGDVMYTVIPKSGRWIDDDKALVWGKENNFEKPLAEGTWEDIKNYFRGN